MQPDEVAQLAARTVPGSGPATLDRLSCGLVNTSYRVVRDGRLYVLRVASSSASAGALEFGLDRAWEMRVLSVASGAGLAPAIEYCDPPAGILVVRWATGRSWSQDEVREPENIQRIGVLVRRIQALPTPAQPRTMSPAAWIDFYRQALERSAARAPPRALPSADALLAALERLPAASPVPCHGDLHRLNLIDGDGALLALDWEYSHVSDPLWDLAGWSSNNDLDDEARHGLLSSYLERPPAPADWSRLKVLAALYDHVCLLWSELYLNVRADGVDQGIIKRMQRLSARLECPVVE
jgi:thiamine kinase-like enzyme